MMTTTCGLQPDAVYRHGTASTGACLLPLLAVLSLLLAGCAMQPAQQPTTGTGTTREAPRSAETAPAPMPAPAPSQSETRPLPVPEPPAPPSVSPAVAALQQQASAASLADDHERAAALLERALRMEPRNAALWHELALARFRGGDDAQAEQFALRSNSLAREPALTQRNWWLIADARARNGDSAGSSSARQRASEIGLR
jgi:type IV secretory pathway VirB10-like protein